MVSEITCLYLSNTTCELRWRNKGFAYTIKKKDSGSLHWEDVASNISNYKHIVNGMVKGKSYKFCVVAINHVGQSNDSIMFYRHK